MANYFNTLNLREQLDQLGRCRFMDRGEFATGDIENLQVITAISVGQQRSILFPLRQLAEQWVNGKSFQ